MTHELNESVEYFKQIRDSKSTDKQQLQQAHKTIDELWSELKKVQTDDPFRIQEIESFWEQITQKDHIIEDFKKKLHLKEMEFTEENSGLESDRV